MDGLEDLMKEFITETVESLGLLDQELLKLEQDPTNNDILSNIFRTVHTIKGSSGFFPGMGRLGKLAHVTENVLGLMRDGVLIADSNVIGVLLESLDTIKLKVDFIERNGTEPESEDAELIAKLNKYAEGKSQPVIHTAPVVESKPTEEAFGFFDEKYIDPPAKVPQPAAAKSAASASKDSGSSNQSIRVNIDVLENLMQMVSELVLNRNQLMQLVRSNSEVQSIFQAPIQQMSYITSELQEGIMKTRMQPIGTAWAKFPRLVRDLSHEMGKKMDLVQIGEDTELDRQLLEMIKDPLTHMVRNSCDHGMEMPADRIAAGKPETGTVTLSAYHEGGHIIVEISDDGRGLNLNKIKEKAVKNGIATPSELEAMPPKQIMQFIFAAGFSTAEKVTEVSGRGVGMDVVRTNIEKMGGTIELSSEMGKGSKFSIKIPLTLAIVPVLIVEANKQKFAIPQINVLELVSASKTSEHKIETINGAPVLRLRDSLLPLTSLRQILHLEEDNSWLEKNSQIIVCKVGSYDFGLIADKIYDTEEIVVKPVTERLKFLDIYSGNTILGDGSVIMILDPNGIAKEIGKVQIDGHSEKTAAEKAAALAEQNAISFLLFKAGKDAPKAVPLELISRLEEIEVDKIEVTGDTKVVQYRGDLMRLITLDKSFPIPESGSVNVIVFAYDKKNIGLIVDSILDIVQANYDIKLETTAKSCLGSMVINGKTTDVVDVATILSELVDEAIANHNLKRNNKQNEPYNILLVEDSPFFRNITEPYLAASGYMITTAEHGAEALEVLSKHPNFFNAIVTDLEMPVMDGYEFASKCRKQSALLEIPIVAYTASMTNEAVTKCKNSGIDECIIKTDRPGLLTAITNLLEQKMGVPA